MYSEIDYSDAKPYPERILRINELYDDGHKIIFLTARGLKQVLIGKKLLRIN